MANISDTMEYVEKLVPVGNYEVTVLETETGMSGKGTPFIKLHVQLTDTIPAGQDIDYDEYEEPFGKVFFPAIYMPMDGDKSGFKKKILRDYIENFSIDLDGVDGSGDLGDPDYLNNLADAFVGAIGGITLKKVTKGRDGSILTSPKIEPTFSCPIA